MTTQNLLTEWLEIYQKEHIKTRTYSRYQGLIAMHIVPMLGERNISELGRREIQEFLTQQKKDGNMRNGERLSATSTNMMLSVLNLAFEYACDMEYIEENPCVRVRRTKAETKKIEAFTVEEQRAIEAEISRSDDRRFHGILLCLYTGLRIGELLGLTWSDVDLERGVIKITKTVYREKDESGAWQLCVDTPKTKASDRVIPLPEYITNMLREDYENAKTPYVVENKKANECRFVRTNTYLKNSPSAREFASSTSTPCAILSQRVPLSAEWTSRPLPISWGIKTPRSPSTATLTVCSTTKSK